MVDGVEEVRASHEVLELESAQALGSQSPSAASAPPLVETLGGAAGAEEAQLTADDPTLSDESAEAAWQQCQGEDTPVPVLPAAPPLPAPQLPEKFAAQRLAEHQKRRESKALHATFARTEGLRTVGRLYLVPSTEAVQLRSLRRGHLSRNLDLSNPTLHHAHLRLLGAGGCSRGCGCGSGDSAAAPPPAAACQASDGVRAAPPPPPPPPPSSSSSSPLQSSDAARPSLRQQRVRWLAGRGGAPPPEPRTSLLHQASGPDTRTAWWGATAGFCEGRGQAGRGTVPWLVQVGRAVCLLLGQ